MNCVILVSVNKGARSFVGSASNQIGRHTWARPSSTPGLFETFRLDGLKLRSLMNRKGGSTILDLPLPSWVSEPEKMTGGVHAHHINLFLPVDCVIYISYCELCTVSWSHS